jgi:hypothetical protein
MHRYRRCRLGVEILSAFHMTSQVMSMMYKNTTHRDVETHADDAAAAAAAAADASDDEAEAAPATSHTMNYHLVMVFHKDTESRPCRPVVSVVRLSSAPHTLVDDIRANPQGLQMVTSCQLGDTSINTTHYFSVQLSKVLCIRAVSITDTEASAMIGNMSILNTSIAQNNTSLTERSNLVLAPVWSHRFMQFGPTSVKSITHLTSATDVQLAVLLMRDSFNKARSIWTRLERLQPYMATPENLYDAVSLFSRKIDINSFKVDSFRFFTV